jgi:hypothetical protein
VDPGAEAQRAARPPGQLNAPDAQQAVKVAIRGLNQTTSTDDLMSTPEARAAAAYWEAWASLPIQFVRADAGKVPEHWRSFGPRRSPISGSPRLAANPANAVLNYLYRLLEAETRLAILVVGLDPGLGFFHTDKRGRDNLVMDVIEACRPYVDGFALRLFERRWFRASDFHETRKGVCRVLPPITHELAETSLIWADAAAPVAEGVARMMGKPRRVRPGVLASPPQATKRRICRHCGRKVESRTRQYCDRCLASQGRTGASLGKARASVRTQRALADWRRGAHEAHEPAIFRREILPLIQKVPVARVMEATGLSAPYCYRIRRGEVVPHARHWTALSALAPPGFVTESP